jgi:hypothetical protein
MNWDYMLTLTGNSLLPVGTLNSQDLAIEFSILNQVSNWYKAGYLYPLINVGGSDIPAQGIFIYFGSQVIQIPYSAYKLRFVPVPYIISPYQLKLFKLPMSINFAPPQPEQLGSEVVTTIPANLTSVILDPANPTRRRGFIVNKSNRNLWVAFSTGVATAAAPNNMITPGSNMDIPEDYTGQIIGIWSGPAPTLNAEVHQFNAV